jgi:hypothetical protein
VNDPQEYKVNGENATYSLKTNKLGKNVISGALVNYNLDNIAKYYPFKAEYYVVKCCDYSKK